MVHAGMAFIMGLVILGVYYLNHQDAITALFTIASYTYGPILGLFIFGIFTKKMVNTKFVAIVCVLAPILSWIISFLLKKYFDYSTGFEIFLINTLITLAGISMAPKEKREESHEKHPIKLSTEEK